MPYSIENDNPDCGGFAVVKDSDGTIMGCHETEQGALDQMAALHINEPDASRGVAPVAGVQSNTISGEHVREGAGCMEIESRELPPSYRPSDSEDVPVVKPACATCEYFCGHLDEAGELVTHCKRWNALVEPDMYCDAYEPKEEESEGEDMPIMEMEPEAPEMEENEVRTVEWLSVDKDEKRSVVYSNLELRAADGSNTLIGYAAVFDTPSVDMGFTEYVSRGAFTKTLKDGADVRLLVDHEGAPLARTKSGTLRLTEDDRGLRVEADLDPANPLAQTVMSALRRGDMNQMSFAFRTIRDQWSKDRAVRELREVQLYDVSVVTFPAYEATVAEVRAQRTAKLEIEGRTRLRKAQLQLVQINSNK